MTRTSKETRGLVRYDLTVDRFYCNLRRDVLAFHVWNNVAINRLDCDLCGDVLTLHVWNDIPIDRLDWDLCGDILTFDVWNNVAINRLDCDLCGDVLTFDVWNNVAVNRFDCNLRRDVLTFDVWNNVTINRFDWDLGRDVLALRVRGDGTIDRLDRYFSRDLAFGGRGDEGEVNDALILNRWILVVLTVDDLGGDAVTALVDNFWGDAVTAPGETLLINDVSEAEDIHIVSLDVRGVLDRWVPRQCVYIITREKADTKLLDITLDDRVATGDRCGRDGTEEDEGSGEDGQLHSCSCIRFQGKGGAGFNSCWKMSAVERLEV